MKLLVLLLLSSYSISTTMFTLPRTCELKYDPTETPSEVTDTWHPLKIHNDITNIDFLRNFDINLYNYISTFIIPSVTDHIKATLRVRETPWVVAPKSLEKCSNVLIPQILRDGLETDLYIFYTATTRSKDEKGWSDYCYQHGKTGRPTIIRVNINPDSFNIQRRRIYMNFRLVLRQVYSALAFKTSLIPCFLQKGTLNRLPTSKTITQAPQTSKFVYQIVSPKVVEFARSHLKCPSITGVPIEDALDEKDLENGGDFFWELVFVGNEMMIQPLIANPVISGYTLNFLQETGFYQVNMEMEEETIWATGIGCSIQNGECPYQNNCQKLGESGCFYDYTFQAACKTIVQSNDCKFMFEDTLKTNDCRLPSLRDKSSILSKGEVYGSGSRCFEGKLDIGFKTDNSLCYPASCKDGKVVITISDAEYTCQYDFQKITPRHVTGGYIKCPQASEFCEMLENSCKDDCLLNGRCLKNKKCFCYTGFKGDNCSITTIESTWLPKGDGQSCEESCSVHGSCIDGKCVCNQGFTGKDYSVYNLIDNMDSKKASSGADLATTYGGILVVILYIFN